MDFIKNLGRLYDSDFVSRTVDQQCPSCTWRLFLWSVSIAV